MQVQTINAGLDYWLRQLYRRKTNTTLAGGPQYESLDIPGKEKSSDFSAKMTDPIDLTIDPLQIPTEKLAEGLKLVNDSDVASSEDQNSGPSNPPAPAILWTSSLDFKYKSPSPRPLPRPLRPQVY